MANIQQCYLQKKKINFLKVLYITLPAIIKIILILKEFTTEGVRTLNLILKEINIIKYS